MTFFVEICGPLQWRPGLFRSRHMLRVWWGLASVGVMRGDMADYHERAASGETQWAAK